MDINMEGKAVISFSSEIRWKIKENKISSMPKHWIGDVLNDSTTEIRDYLIKRYSPGVLKNFLGEHPDVFFVNNDGPDSTVNVASKLMCQYYVDYITWKNQETEKSRGIEKTAILHFSNKLRQLLPVYLGRTKLSYIPKGHLNDLLNECPSDIRAFLQTQYTSPTPLESLENFVKKHDVIFPESKSGKSVNVLSSEFVFKYIEKLRLGESVCSEDEVASEYSDDDGGSETSDDESLTYEDMESLLYLADKMNKFKKEKSQECIPIVDIETWYEQCINVYNTVLQEYQGSFDNFLDKHDEVFWENDDDEYETKSYEELEDYINNYHCFGENGYITEQEKSAVIAIWNLINCLDFENDANYSSLCDFFDVCGCIHTAVEENCNSVLDFLDDHDHIFKISFNGKSYRLIASMKEIGEYVFA